MSTYSIYFVRSNGDKILVSKGNTEEEIFPQIKAFILSKNPHFFIHYVRTWGENPVVYDVGSHSEFFHVYNEDEKEEE